MRPINNVVDITNYVMLMTAQPLHAFDLDKVPDGALIVRTAKQGEKMTTLDGVERSFDEDTVLVCDRNGPSGIAGIMGGAGLRGLGDDHPRAARGRDLERGQHPADLAQARPALRRLQPLREAAPPRAGDAGAADRLAADGRALRREARAGDDRRRRRDPRAAPARAAHTSGSRRLLGMPIEPELCARVPGAARLRGRRQGRRPEGDGPGPPPLRRHPRGGPDRGGRPDPRLRGQPARRPCRRRAARPGGSPASSACAAAPRT